MCCRLFWGTLGAWQNQGPPTTDKISAYSDATPAGQWVSPPGQDVLDQSDGFDD